MNDDISQYKDLYLQTSREYLQALSDNLLKLEKNQTDPAAIDEIFRSAHSLKSQSAAMGYEKTGFLCHTIEDVFYEIKQGHLALTAELADVLFRALDTLTESINTIDKNDQEIDTTTQAEELKTHTGVTTSGAGKSVHSEDSKPPAPPPPTSPPAPIPSPPSVPHSTTQKVKTITLSVEQLDTMMNLIEDILIHQLGVGRVVRELQHTELTDHHDKTSKILQNLQYEIMKARLIPVSVVFNHLPRTIRDLARAENKQINLTITDDNLAIDRAIVERLDEPLIHILRNAVSHGIQHAGTITISTKKERGWAVITIQDDGQGIDWDALKKKCLAAGASPDMPLEDMLFFGVSTSETVTSISGRGVGMKAVKQTIENFGGQIDVASQPGHGTTFTLRFPMSLAISKVLMILVGKTVYVLPVNNVERIITLPSTALRTTAGQEAFVLDKTEVPLIRLHQKLEHIPSDEKPAAELSVVVVLINAEKVGLQVDRLVGALDAVVKPLPETLKANRLFTGATILDNGQTALIINPQALIVSG